jgi:hypothetical protein
MKDPLDVRKDPYQRFNEEAEAQGKPPQASRQTKPMDVRRLYGPLRASSKNPAGLQEAYDKLTRVEKRLEEDILFYWVEEHDMLAGGQLAEPAWQWDQSVPAPDLAIDGSFLRIVTGMEDQFLEPLRFRPIALRTFTRYDEVHLPPRGITFEN